MGTFDLVSRVLFPSPESSYSIDDFPEELIWVPRSLDPKDAAPEDCIPCLFLPSPSARFLVYYLHSNAEDLGRCYPFCALLRYQFQVHVLAVEYPGYGLCPGGQADGDSVTENAFVAFRFIHQVLKWPLDGILLMGRSIGTGPALALAAEHAVYGLILVSPFSSVQEVCRDIIGPLAFMIEERFANKERVVKVRSPMLLVHGKKDQVVPVNHGERLYAACRSRKRLVCPEQMEHNTNLHADASYFVLPMLQFFGLPDYCFDEIEVPSWVFDKRLSTHYQGDLKDERAPGTTLWCDPGTRIPKVGGKRSQSAPKTMPGQKGLREGAELPFTRLDGLSTTRAGASAGLSPTRRAPSLVGKPEAFHDLPRPPEDEDKQLLCANASSRSSDNLVVCADDGRIQDRVVQERLQSRSGSGKASASVEEYLRGRGGSATRLDPEEVEAPIAAGPGPRGRGAWARGRSAPPGPNESEDPFPAELVIASLKGDPAFMPKVARQCSSDAAEDVCDNEPPPPDETPTVKVPRSKRVAPALAPRPKDFVGI